MIVMVMMRVPVMPVAAVVVTVVGVRRHRPADGSQAGEERASFHPQQPRAEERDQRIASGLDVPDGASHRGSGGVERDRRDTHERDRHERPEQRRG